ncbi:dynamin family protein [Helicobacter sp. 11S03491-1]|uniref:dynamin family protein n=1 Tax=Helicobacter sp. 11S03491-1 TaxID=1476196 RepID=UPI000BA576DF|nr:dynamin family protein [Helicobacter sp. 11S03491-1]PAF41727.1 hypothetical protein BKH45_06470 [Helicobacter sp. 11S03491-1]
MKIQSNIAEYFFSLVYAIDIPEFSPLDLRALAPYPQKEIFAIILSCNHRNRNIFNKTLLFQKLFKYLRLKITEKNIQALQKTILDYIQKQGDLNFIHELFQNIDILKIKGVILYEEEQCIKTSFKHWIYQLNNPIKKHSKISRKTTKTFDIQGSWFYQNIQNIEKTFEKIKTTINMPLWLQQFTQNEITQLKKTKMRISLCGISKSGKSTLLNTLLYKEILPISAIPESSNKITIAYSPKTKGEVKFLTQTQWQQLLENLYFDDDLRATIQESQNSFGNFIDSHITQEGLTIQVKPEDIKAYASSKHECKISYLVQEIAIYSSMELLKNNLILINTPNIDTNFNYKTHQIEDSISTSNMILYLINASKPLSQKDIYFLSNIIYYENLEKILVVFTRSDLVSLSDLKNLSTNIIQNIQKTQNANSTIFQNNISKIDFIPVASTLALLHRTQRSDEALCRGYDIEDTGILTLENHINNILFAKPAKYSKNTLLNTYAIINQVAIKCLYMLQDTATKENKNPDKELEKIRMQILNFAQEIIQAIQVAVEISKIKIKDLGLNLKEHLLDFINYKTSKNNYINVTRIENIITTNLKDSLRYLIQKNQETFDKKLKIFCQNIHLAYHNIKLDDFELALLKSHETNLLETTKYQYTEGDLNLYTDELRKYISYILRDGTKLKDIQNRIDKAFELSYKNIIIYLEKKIENKKNDFIKNIHHLIQTMEFVIIHNNKIPFEINSEKIPAQIKELSKIQNMLSSEIKNLQNQES